MLPQYGLYGQTAFIGNFKSIKSSATGILIKAENAGIQIMYYSPSVIRIRIAREFSDADFSYAVVAKQEAGGFKTVENKETILLSTDSLKLEIQKNPIRIQIKNAKGRLLSEEYSPFGTGWQGEEITCYRRLFADEKFIGLGEKTGNLNRRDNKYEMWNSDVPAYLVTADPLYVSIPFFMGIHDSLTYGIFLDNSSRTKFDFAASSDNLFSRFSVAEGELNYYFFGASTIAGILRDYTWLTGRMSLPPYWSLGFQQCRWSYYPDTEVLDVARQFRARKIPCDLIYLDIEMPGLTGQEVLAAIKSSPRHRDIPVVMLTGMCDEKQMQIAARNGANSYTLKPARADQFFKALRVSTAYWVSIHQHPGSHWIEEECRR